jgi:hypothetical protein
MKKQQYNFQHNVSTPNDKSYQHHTPSGTFQRKTPTRDQILSEQGIIKQKIH